jgi:hypothetical protein
MADELVGAHDIPEHMIGRRPIGAARDLPFAQIRVIVDDELRERDGHGDERHHPDDQQARDGADGVDARMLEAGRMAVAAFPLGTERTGTARRDDYSRQGRFFIYAKIIYSTNSQILENPSPARVKKATA